MMAEMHGYSAAAAHSAAAQEVPKKPDHEENYTVSFQHFEFSVHGVEFACTG
jgi:hypothetical protein